MRCLVVLLLAGPLALAVELPRAEGGTDLAPQPPPGWASDGRLGIFTTNIATANANTSRDPGVNSGPTSTSFIGTFDGTLWWRAETPDEAEQKLLARYGRSRSGDGDWAETTDTLEYDGVFRHRYQPRRALYASLVVASAFVGPSPALSPFDPIRGAAAFGHSWLWENLLPLTDRLEARTGVRTQKRWGTGLDEHVRRIEVGPETYLRYQRKQSADLNWWVQAELFSDFDDIAHLQGLATAALQLQLTRIINVDLRLRAYYEHHPAALPATESRVGYDELGLRQETLLGVVATW
jgi:hypothetical protein